MGKKTKPKPTAAPPAPNGMDVERTAQGILGNQAMLERIGLGGRLTLQPPPTAPDLSVPLQGSEPRSDLTTPSTVAPANALSAALGGLPLVGDDWAKWALDPQGHVQSQRVLVPDLHGRPTQDHCTLSDSPRDCADPLGTKTHRRTVFEF